MKKTIDLMAQTLDQHHLKDYIPDNARKNPSSERGNGHALLAISSSPNSWVLIQGIPITWPGRIDFSHTWRLVSNH
jgi:hypothetical protein